MLYRVKSKKTLAEVVKALEASAQKHKFGVLAVHDLKQKLKDKGVEFDRDCLVYEVCNPQQAKKVLEANAEISTALPCRISVYREDDGITLATIRPTVLLNMFDVPGLRGVAEEVEQTMLQMMDDAAK